MPPPQQPDKYDSRPVLTAADLLARRRATGQGPRANPPPAAILCFHHPLLAYAARRFRGSKVPGFGADFFLLKRQMNQVALVGNFGVGAPAAAVLLEDLVAFGVRRFVAVGLAGSLQPDLGPGSIVLADRALRDEGTSHHYRPATPFAHPDPDLLTALGATLTARGLPWHAGATWTTDAPYRETAVEVARYAAEGLLTVEMEAAALYTVAAELDVALISAFVVADQVSPAGWAWRPESGVTEGALQAALDGALAVLAS